MVQRAVFVARSLTISDTCGAFLPPDMSTSASYRNGTVRRLRNSRTPMLTRCLSWCYRQSALGGNYRFSDQARLSTTGRLCVVGIVLESSRCRSRFSTQSGPSLSAGAARIPASAVLNSIRCCFPAESKRTSALGLTSNGRQLAFGLPPVAPGVESSDVYRQ